MERLYIVRHGIAVPPGTPEIPDDLRPLTPKGERRTRQVARGLRRFGVAPQRIVSSPLPRARRTAEILDDILGPSDGLEEVDALHASEPAESIRDWLTGRSEESLLVVGHNPAVSDLVGLLILGEPSPPICELPKAGVAALILDPGGGYRLEWLATPRLLRRYD